MKTLRWPRIYSRPNTGSTSPSCAIKQTSRSIIDETKQMQQWIQVQYWIDIANEDLEVAEDLFKTKHWLYVAFMCHQADKPKHY